MLCRKFCIDFALWLVHQCVGSISPPEFAAAAANVAALTPVQVQDADDRTWHHDCKDSAERLFANVISAGIEPTTNLP